MKTFVKIPESYRDYATDRTIQSVVDHLLEQKDKDLPTEIDWSEVRAYHQAWLSAQKVKTDYILLLMDLWDAIWKPTLEKHGIKKVFDIDEMKEDDAHPARSIVWDDGVFYCHFHYTIKKKSFRIYTSIAISDEIVEIHLYILDEDDEIYFIDDYSSDFWRMNEDDYLVTQDNNISIEKSVNELDVSKLIHLADEAISAFIKYASKP